MTMNFKRKRTVLLQNGDTVRNQVKHLLIILSILLLSSPVIGQSSKYESVSQCVLQTMEDRKLTGNKMFEMVKEECERSLGMLEDKKRGVLYFGLRNGKYGWEEDGLSLIHISEPTRPY